MSKPVIEIPFLSFLEGSWKKVLGVIGVVLVCALLFFALYPKIMGVLTTDDNILEDADLRYHATDVPLADNLYFDLVHTPDFLGDIRVVDQHNKGAVWDVEFVEKTLRQNAAILAVFDRAAMKPYFRDPLLVDLQKITHDAIGTDLVNWKNASKLSVLKAGALAREGKGDEALAEALKSVAVGEKIESSAASLVEYLVGMTIKKNGLKASRDVISLTSVSREKLADYASALSFFLRNGANSLKSALRAEYLASKNAVNFSVSSGGRDFLKQNLAGMELASIAGSDNFYLRPNKTIGRIADDVRTVELAIEKPCGMTRWGSIRAYSRTSWYFTDNAVGEILADVVGLGMRSMAQKYCEEEFDVAATRLIFALRMYELDHGDLPSSIYALVPKYMTSIPLDPFTRQELKYSIEKRILYSRGMDMEDNGGSTPDVFDAADPTVEIRF